MSSYALEILAECHDRAGFASGLESVDRYLRETARSHLEKGISVTRVLHKVRLSTGLRRQPAHVPPQCFLGDRRGDPDGLIPCPLIC